MAEETLLNDLLSWDNVSPQSILLNVTQNYIKSPRTNEIDWKFQVYLLVISKYASKQYFLGNTLKYTLCWETTNRHVAWIQERRFFRYEIGKKSNFQSLFSLTRWRLDFYNNIVIFMSFIENLLFGFNISKGCFIAI